MGLCTPGTNTVFNSQRPPQKIKTPPMCCAEKVPTKNETDIFETIQYDLNMKNLK